jgi:hypothetical protein
MGIYFFFRVKATAAARPGLLIALAFSALSHNETAVLSVSCARTGIFVVFGEKR